MSKVRFHFQRTLQLVDFEPIQFGVDFESDSNPDETDDAMLERVFMKTADLFNEVQSDVLAAFRAKAARVKSSQGGRPPPITKTNPAPPAKK